MQAGIGLSGVVAVWLANLILPRLFPIIQPDSYSYLDFRAIRTSFYPLFLRHVHDGAEDYQTVLTVQVAFHAVAFGVLLLGLARARLPLSALILLLVATALNPFLQSFHHTVLTESLAFSLTFLASGAFCLFVSERRKVFLALTTLFASMATALKLSALPLLIGLIMASVLVMMLRRPRHRKQTFSWVALLLPVFIVLVCENRAFFDVHEHREGVLERHLFGKAVLIQAITP
ncbi:MAG: hypothetical protein VX120_03270, partial [Pseudomonadota bacterium]|nr:hypothetical protein [Pseudomonadota bacterium]MEC8129824.1 hypothetical protein [Pseudomonadota bacterium]